MGCCIVVGNNDKELVYSNHAEFEYIDAEPELNCGYQDRMKSVTFSDIVIPEHFRNRPATLILTGYTGLGGHYDICIIDEHKVEINVNILNFPKIDRNFPDKTDTTNQTSFKYTV